MTTIRTDTTSPQSGITLVEIAIALSLLVMVSVSVSLTIVHGMQHRRETFQLYQARTALRDMIADVQETANLPQNLPTQEGIGAVYAKYNNQTFTVTNLPAGQIAVTCFANEATVPLALGGPQDLNFDGDMQDDLGNQSAGTDLRLVPMTFSATFTEGGVTHTVTVNRLVTKTTT